VVAVPIGAEARALHERALVWDAHMDTLQAPVCEGVDLGVPTAGWPDLGDWRRGGIRVQVFAIWVDTIYGPTWGLRRALQQVDAFHRLCERHPEQIEAARTGADIRRIVKSGRLAGLLSLEGGMAIQNDLAVLRTFHDLGVSSMTLTHSNSIDWVDSSTDVARSNGLSSLGREVVAEMNRLGMVVDVSHVSDQAVRDVLATSNQPVVASHSCAHALHAHPRNLTDSLVRGIAEGGGVVGLNFMSMFLDAEIWRAYLEQGQNLLADLNRPPTIEPAELDREAARRLRTFFAGELPPLSIESLLDHLIHLLAVAGADHVGLGSDMGSPGLAFPTGLESPADFPLITEGMLRRGVPPSTVEKVLGKNFLRVWEEVTRS